VLVVLVGAIVGATAGYCGGRTDRVLDLIINVSLVMPALPLMVVMASHLPPGSATMIVVLVATGWAWTARVVRAQALSLRQRDFVLAAIVAGERPWRVVLVEMLPNMLPLLASCLVGAIIYAVGAAVGLEFLGLGDVSAVTWGTNLYWAANDGALLTGSWWTFVPAGVGIALTGFALTLLGVAIDEAGNPRLRRDRAYAEATRGHAGAATGASTPVLRERRRRA
jgi:peptide/nickel transport system permease protein